jgi:hypothetical protein
VHTGGYVVFLADFEAGEDFVVGHGGMQETVIDHFGEIVQGDVEGYWVCHCLVYFGLGVVKWEKEVRAEIVVQCGVATELVCRAQVILVT